MQAGRNLEEIEAFIAVAEQGGFAAAAKKIERDPSVLSRRVSQLEARLGVQLLAPTTRSVALTDAGLSYLKRVQVVLEELAIADREASDKAATLKGTIRATFPNTFGRMWIAPLLPKFLSAHPLIRIEATFTDQFTDIVAEGFDVAVRVGVMRDSGLISRKLAGHRTLLCASPRYLAERGIPRSPGELVQHSCLGFQRIFVLAGLAFAKRGDAQISAAHLPLRHRQCRNGANGSDLMRQALFSQPTGWPALPYGQEGSSKSCQVGT